MGEACAVGMAEPNVSGSAQGPAHTVPGTQLQLHPAAQQDVGNVQQSAHPSSTAVSAGAEAVSLQGCGVPVASVGEGRRSMTQKHVGNTGVEFLPVACSVEQQQQQRRQQQPRLALGVRLRRRTNWRFYWTWAKRLLLIRVLMYMLPS